VTGLSDKDATLITFGRALFRDHRVSSELWSKMVSHFGRQHTIQIMAIMGDYFKVGLMLNAVDQQCASTSSASQCNSRSAACAQGATQHCIRLTSSARQRAFDPHVFIAPKYTGL
jgi:hypothetical protein